MRWHEGRGVELELRVSLCFESARIRSHQDSHQQQHLCRCQGRESPRQAQHERQQGKRQQDQRWSWMHRPSGIDASSRAASRTARQSRHEHKPPRRHDRQPARRPQPRRKVAALVAPIRGLGHKPCSWPWSWPWSWSPPRRTKHDEQTVGITIDSRTRRARSARGLLVLPLASSAIDCRRLSSRTARWTRAHASHVGARAGIVSLRSHARALVTRMPR